LEAAAKFLKPFCAAGISALCVDLLELRGKFRRAAVVARAENEIEQFLDSDCGPVKGDRERLQQVIWNLLSNAIKFGNPHAKIQITPR